MSLRMGIGSFFDARTLPLRKVTMVLLQTNMVIIVKPWEPQINHGFTIIVYPRDLWLYKW